MTAFLLLAADGTAVCFFILDLSPVRRIGGGVN